VTEIKALTMELTAERATLQDRVEDRSVEHSESQRGFIDGFSEERRGGGVVGRPAGTGVVRHGIDREGVIGIDNGALRIGPLVKPGWGRAGIAYGPFTRRNGLAFGVSMLNGHNISRVSPLPDGFALRVWRWIYGSESERPLKRMMRWPRTAHTAFMWRRVRQWFRDGTKLFKQEPLDENLAVGWFPGIAPTDPVHQGSALVMHAVIPEGGELWARNGRTFVRALRGIQNVPMFYVVVLREAGAAYYAASLPGVPGLTAFPTLRLLAIDSTATDETVYAGIHQSVLGETGFRADTRVYRTQVAELEEFRGWYGSAHLADSLTGDGLLQSSPAERGEKWVSVHGEFHRGDRGTVGSGTDSLAFLSAREASGFVHLLIDLDDSPVEGVSLLWRAQDADNYWCIEVSSAACQLNIREQGRLFAFPSSKLQKLVPNVTNSLQVFDDGENIRLYLNTDLIYGTTFSDRRFSSATGIGIRVRGSGSARLRGLEAHPRSIPMPKALGLEAPRLSTGARVVVEDRFEGAAGDLAGRQALTGNARWRREIGPGAIELTGDGAARVAASPARPCPGRTAYTVQWLNPSFADVEVSITPPGTRKGMKERGRAGLIFWQDPDNYVILSAFIGDYPAMSIAAFFQVDGFEELYDAVWSNVGSRMHFGVPHDFRVVFDGDRFVASIDGEPVLYRAMHDVYPKYKGLSIQRVGIVANWEWGNDTGSVFRNFIARDRA
jgi:hypothetical protein